MRNIILFSFLFAGHLACSDESSEKKTSVPPSGDKEESSIPLSATTESIQKDVVDKHCIGCHSGETPAHNLDLSDISTMIVVNDDHDDKEEGGDDHQHDDPLFKPGSADESRFYQVIANKIMPPQPNQQVPDSYIPVIKDWLDNLKVD